MKQISVHMSSLVVNTVVHVESLERFLVSGIDELRLASRTVFSGPVVESLYELI
jgi:hypothetical protein